MADETVKKEKAPKAGRGFTVTEAQELVPVERPLVIVPDGEWANEAQAEFAKTLNGYAYKNPEKWEIKKDALLAQLERLAKFPGEILRLRGQIDPLAEKITITNTLIDIKK